MTGDPDLPAVARGIGRGFSVMLVGGLLGVAASVVVGPLTGVLLTGTAIGAFAVAAWDVHGPLEGGLAGGGTYLLFLPLAFLGEGPAPTVLVVLPLLAGAVAVGALVGWWRGR